LRALMAYLAFLEIIRYGAKGDMVK